jgi:hypothetical protein
MAELEPRGDDSISFAGAVLDRYRHVCAFVDSSAEEHRLFDPFVIEGVEQGERLLFIVNPAERANQMRHFRHLGLDMPKLLEQGQFELRTWSEAYLRGGRFDKDAMLNLVDDILGGARSPRLRLVGDMGWAADLESVHDLLEYEARLNYLVPNYKHVAICVYDTAKFGGDIVIDVLRTHPMALVGGVLYENPFFVPPDEFLDELRQRGPNAEDG